jgi:HEAT repeat protein
MKDDDPSVRAAAAGSLGRLGNPVAIDPLLAASKEEFFDVRLAAGAALAQLGNPQGAKVLAECLADENPRNLDRALFAITTSNIKSEELVEPLIALMESPSTGARANGASILGRIGSEKGVEALIARLSHREDLMWTLQGLGLSGHPRALDSIIPYLRDEQPDIRGFAVTQVARFKKEEHVDLLAPLMSDPSPEVRANVIQAFAMLGFSKAIDLIKPALEDEDDEVQAQAEVAIRKLQE